MVVYDGKEPHEQHYIMVGDQIKYEPAWVLNDEHRQTMKALNVQGNTRTLAGKFLLQNHLFVLYNRIQTRHIADKLQKHRTSN